MNPSTGTLPRPSAALRRARLGVFASFLACGFAVATWVVHIPRLMDNTGLNEAGLGVLLLVLGVGALLAMQAGGSLAARWGSRPVQAWGTVVMLLGILAVSLAPDPLWLGAGLILFGIGNGALDLAMNEQAVRVEQAYGRPIMSAFHAFFSVGGALGALLGGTLLALNLPTVVSMGIMGAVCAAVSLGALPVLMPSHAAVAAAAGEDLPAPTQAPARSQVLRLGLVLGSLAFAFFLAEGTVNDWSSRHAVEHFGTSESLAAAAYGTFSVAMTIGRLCADRVAGRFGAGAVVRYGSLVAAVGLLGVVLLPSFAWAVVGWGLYGLGLSGIVPQLFTAAGALVPGPRGAVVLARVVGAGYVGMLAGPAIVGGLAGLVGLNQALALPVVLCLIGCALSFTLRLGVPGGAGTAPQEGTTAPAHR
ncbi:MAG: MFS transporter [Arthrobacter sp.]|nr:MFS transporter [Arthrobacter sp.]